MEHVIAIALVQGGQYAEVLKFSTKAHADQWAKDMAPQDVLVLASQIEVEALSSADLIELHNTILPAKKVNKFADRKTAVRRVLSAAADLALSDAQVTLKDDDQAWMDAEKNPMLKDAETGDAGTEAPADVVAPPARVLTPKQLKLEELVAEGKAKNAKRVKQPKAPKAKSDRSRERGVNLKAHPVNRVFPARAGSKQAKFIDMLYHVAGTTMNELLHAMSLGGKPWTEASVKTGLNWDVHSVKGYGVRTEFHSGEQLYEGGHYDDANLLGFSPASQKHWDELDEGEREAARKAGGYDATRQLAVYFLVLPEGMDAPHAHTEAKTAKPAKKADAPAPEAAQPTA